MKRKPKDVWNVYSVFSSELQDYPYYPFIAKNHSGALAKFVDFVSNRETICNGAELHCIGECKVNSEGIIEGSIQPLLYPIRVTTKQNLISKIFLMSIFYRNIVGKYLEKVLKMKGEQYGKKQ